MDFTEYPMGLYGGLVALFIFGVFIGTWWWYGMRAMAASKHLVPVAAPSDPAREPHGHAHPARA